MSSKKITAIISAIVLICIAALVLGCTSPNPTPTPTGTAVSATPTVAPLSGSILIGGSTTVQPLSDLIAKQFMANNTGVKITVQGGGSGAGEVGIGKGTFDIGAASEMVPAATMKTYPNITTYTVGGSGVAIIAGSGVTVPANGFSIKDLADSYASGKPVASLASAGIKEIYTRAESSGTADSFGGYLFTNKTYIYANTSNNLRTANGNDGVLAAVQGDPNGLGFVDFGFTHGATGIQLVPAQDSSGKSYTPSDSNIKAGLKDYFAKQNSSTNYPLKLVRPLNYLTNGPATGIVKSYIDFAMTANNEFAFQQCGYFSMQDINNM